MTDGIKGKVVAITGASSGIGEATARHLARRGARVVLGARRSERLDKTVADIRSKGGVAMALALDVTQRADFHNLAATASTEFGRLDVLVNNAGVMLLAPVADLAFEEWDRMIDVNIKGVLNGIGAVLPIMQRQASGHIINVSSVAGHLVAPGFAVYCATKFAVRAISEGFRQEADASIRSTIISPGAVNTELATHITSDATKNAVDAMYQAASLSADVIAEAIAYAISQPTGVDVNEILIRPTAQVF